MRYAFISYVHENQEAVFKLCDDLRDHGIQIWLDREQIKPGRRWRSAIRQAIQDGAFFIACFSDEYNARERSFMNEELTLAIEELRLRPTNRSWFIPVTFSPNAVPDRDIGAGETLRDLQWVNLSGEPFSLGWTDEVRRIAYIITHTDLQASGMDPITQVRAAVVQHNEPVLRGTLKAVANEIINSALQEFIDDKEQGSYGQTLRPVCELYGNQFTKEQVAQLVTRGRRWSNSRTGFHGLCDLYDLHFAHMKSLNLPYVFRKNFIIAYYCKLREKYPGQTLGQILSRKSEELEIDGISVDPETYSDKFMNRGSSAFIDAIVVKKFSILEKIMGEVFEVIFIKIPEAVTSRSWVIGQLTVSAAVGGYVGFKTGTIYRKNIPIILELLVSVIGGFLGAVFSLISSAVFLRVKIFLLKFLFRGIRSSVQRHMFTDEDTKLSHLLFK